MTLSAGAIAQGADRPPGVRQDRRGRRTDRGAPSSWLRSRGRSCEPSRRGARVAIHSAPETGKTQLGALCIAWMLGRDPSLRCAIVSGTVQQSERDLRLVASIVTSNAYQQVFPGRGTEALTREELFVTGRPPGMKDANCFASSYGLSSMMGRAPLRLRPGR